jgi:alpha-tubulin suppressor-like RCC1 family protein
VRQVSAGNGFACAVLRSGEVWCWGSSANGRLGTGAPTGNHAAPVRIVGLDDIDKVSAGDAFACAHRQNDSAILCWGKNDLLQLGHDPTKFQDALGPYNATPVPVQGIPGVLDVEVGSTFACAWDTTTTYCWGSNTAGQLAVAASPDPTAPIKTPLEPLTAMALSIDPSSPNGCALRLDKSAVCWGANDNEQRGDDGGGAPIAIPKLRSVDSVGSGSGINCAINGSTLVCAGTNHQGELGMKTPDTTPVFLASDAGAIHQLSLRTHTACAIDGPGGDGPVRCWGTNNRGQVGDGQFARVYDAGSCQCSTAPEIVDGLPATLRFHQVSAGGTNTVALDANGQVWAWGGNTVGECGQVEADGGVPNCTAGASCQPVAERVIGFPVK